MRCRNQCKVGKIYVTNWQLFSCLGQRFTPIVIDPITHSRTKTYIHSQEVKVQSIAPIVFMGARKKGEEDVIRLLGVTGHIQIWYYTSNCSEMVLYYYVTMVPMLQWYYAVLWLMAGPIYRWPLAWKREQDCYQVTQ